MEGGGSSSGKQLSFFRRLLGSNHPNPGKFEDIAAEARKVFHIDTFEGIKAEYQRGLSNNFGVSHTIHLQQTPEGYGTYDFGANFSQGKHLLLSRSMTNGDVLAQYICTATPNLSIRCQSQLSKAPHQSSGMANFDYKGSDWTGTLKVGNFAQWGLAYIQSVTKNLALGVDITYIGKPPFNQAPIHICTAAMRYSNDAIAAVAQLTTSGRLTASYARRIKDFATFATEMTVDLGSRESVCLVGYEYASNFGTLKTNISTERKVTALLEKPLSEVSGVTVSAELDHRQGTCKYGIGVHLAQ